MPVGPLNRLPLTPVPVPSAEPDWMLGKLPPTVLVANDCASAEAAPATSTTPQATTRRAARNQLTCAPFRTRDGLIFMTFEYSSSLNIKRYEIKGGKH